MMDDPLATIVMGSLAFCLFTLSLWLLALLVVFVGQFVL